MTSFQRLAGTIAAAALALSPTLAAAAPASPAASLSVAKAARAGTPAKGNHIAAGGTATLINIGILAALVAVVLVATDGGDDDSDSN